MQHVTDDQAPGGAGSSPTGGLDRLNTRDFARLAKFIQDYSGIKMPPGKMTMVEGRLRRRVRATGAPNLNAYCRYLFDQDGLEEVRHGAASPARSRGRSGTEPRSSGRRARRRGIPPLAGSPSLLRPPRIRDHREGGLRMGELRREQQWLLGIGRHRGEVLGRQSARKAGGETCRAAIARNIRRRNRADRRTRPDRPPCPDRARAPRASRSLDRPGPARRRSSSFGRSPARPRTAAPAAVRASRGIAPSPSSAGPALPPPPLVPPRRRSADRGGHA